MFQLPFQVNDYLIQELMKAGYLSDVFVAQSMITKEEICVKIIKKLNGNCDRILNEIKILQSLSHPNII
jgi:serine/threonine protein kinase